MTISFWLSRAGTVVFLVDEVYPRCRYVGKFLVRGRRGLNVVRFTGRVRRRQLRPGTYRLNAYPRSQRQRRLTGVTVVILRNRAGRAAIAAAQERNVCPAGQSSSVRAALVARRNAGPSDRATGSVAGVRTTPERKRVPEEGGGLTGVRSAVAGAVGSAADTIYAAADAVPPGLFALAALAVLLLAIASMPQPVRTSRAAAALVHHRGTIAIAGAGVLGAAIVSFALL